MIRTEFPTGQLGILKATLEGKNMEAQRAEVNSQLEL
jgi:hypothetical protein